MSETPTVAEAAAAPPPASGGSSGDKQPGQPLAYMLTHQSGVVIVVALIIALLVGAALIRYQGVSPWYAYETFIREAIYVEGGLTRTLRKTAPLILTGLAVASAALRDGAYARWLGWTSLVLGGITALFLISPLQYMAGMTGPVWLVVVAVGLLRTSRGA